MLKLKYLFEDYNLAKLALENWEHDESNLDEMLSRFRISSNAIYPYQSNGKLCFLRLAPFEEKLRNNILGELEFLDYLHENGFSALKGIAARNGEKLIELHTHKGSYYAESCAAVSGTPIEDTDYSDEIMYEYGKTLGRLHKLSAEFTPKVRKWTHTDALDYVAKIFAEYNAPQCALSELIKVKEKLSELPINKESYGLVHYDFEPDNVFYDEKTKTCSVIDFDDGMYHFYALDIAQVLDSLEDELDGDKLASAKAEFMRGYKSERGFSEENCGTLPLMLRFINLFGYARLIRCIDEKFDNEPDWLTELRVKLDHIIKRKENGFECNAD